METLVEEQVAPETATTTKLAYEATQASLENQIQDLQERLSLANQLAESRLVEINQVTEEWNAAQLDAEISDGAAKLLMTAFTKAVGIEAAHNWINTGEVSQSNGFVETSASLNRVFFATMEGISKILDHVETNEDADPESALVAIRKIEQAASGGVGGILDSAFNEELDKLKRSNII